MRFCLLFLLPLLLGGCAELAVHREVSAGTLAGLERLVIPRDEFHRRMAPKGNLPPGPVSVPFQMQSGVPVLKAGMGGKPQPMLMDTGAFRSLVQARVAVKNRIPMLSAEDATIQLLGVAGNEKGRLGLLDPLTLGNWSLPGYACLVRTYENRVINARGGSSFPDNLLGFDIAMNHASYLTFDYSAGLVTFGFRHSYSPQRVPAGGGHSFRIKSGVPFLTLGSGRHRWEAIVDTGSFNGVEINEETAARLGVQNQGEIVHGLYLMAVGGTLSSAEANLRTVKLPALALPGKTWRDVSVDIAPGPPRIGNRFLKDYRVTFDFQRHKLWLE